ncbi:uncharacterized protein LOC143285259 [Babylonia areolata]|uniref:uncharacterized protein LOC143285259 n=1 Tax=Babylonia areolata TaxID=304850 RepID=UPI003FD64E8A
MPGKGRAPPTTATERVEGEKKVVAVEDGLKTTKKAGRDPVAGEHGGGGGGGGGMKHNHEPRHSNSQPLRQTQQNLEPVVWGAGGVGGGGGGGGGGVSGMMKKLKRRLSWTIKGSRPLDDTLSELAEHLTIEDSTNTTNTNTTNTTTNTTTCTTNTNTTSTTTC